MSKWKTVRLGDVCEIAAGQGAPQGDSNYCDEGTPFVKAGNLIELIEGKSEKQIQKVSEEVAKSHKLKKYKASSILFAKSGMSCMKGYVYQLKNDCYVVSHLAIVKPKEDFSDYIEYCLRHIKPNTLVKDEAYPSISLRDISNLQIPLPPLETQKQIAAVLDKCTSLISKYKQILKKYDTLIKSRFIEMFGTEKDFSKWNCCKVEELADVTVGVVIKPTQYYCEKGIPAFRSLNIGEMKVNDSDWVYFNEEGMKKNIKSILKENDVLVVRSGAPGKSCVITKKYEGYNVVDAIIAHPNLEKINPVFLCMFTNMPHGMNQIKAKTGGAAQQHFNVGGYNDLNIILPPLDLQNDFASFVQQIDKSKFEIEKIVKMVYN